MKILLAVDGSKHSLKAVKCLIEHAGWYREPPGVELVNVHLPVPRIRGMGAVVAASQVRRYYDREGKAALAKRGSSWTRRGSSIPHASSWGQWPNPSSRRRGSPGAISS